MLMARHGRAIIPFGKHKGMRVAHLPDAYLSWLAHSWLLGLPQWGWLRESVAAELRWRGFPDDVQPDPPPPQPEPRISLPSQRRKIIVE